MKKYVIVENNVVVSDGERICHVYRIKLQANQKIRQILIDIENIF